MNGIAGIGDEVLLKMLVAEDMANKIIRLWKSEYGEILDFGGGEKDVIASDVLAACNGKPEKAMKLFDLTRQEAKGLLAALM